MKLQPIPYLSAGISAWGLGNLPNHATGGSISTDVWLADFIRSHSEIDSIDQYLRQK